MTKKNKHKLSIYYFVLMVLIIGLIPITRTIGYQDIHLNSFSETELNLNNEITRGGSMLYANGNIVYLLQGYYGLEIYNASIKDDPVVVDSFRYPLNVSWDYTNLIVQNDIVYFYSHDMDRLSILDCSDVTNIQSIANLTLPDAKYREFAVHGWNLYAITATEFSIFNFTDYSSISLLDTYTNASSNFSDITIKGNYSLLLDSSSGVAIFNTTDSTAIQKVNQSIIDAPSTFLSFFVDEDYLYIYEQNTTLHIFNITDLLAITYFTNYTIITYDLQDLLIYGNHLFVLYSSSFDILDISNLADIQKIGTYDCPYISGFRDISVDGNFAYLTSTQSGELQGRRPLYIVDITNLELPIHIYPEDPNEFLDRLVKWIIIIAIIVLAVPLLIIAIVLPIVTRRKKKVIINGTK